MVLGNGGNSSCWPRWLASDQATTESTFGRPTERYNVSLSLFQCKYFFPFTFSSNIIDLIFCQISHLSYFIHLCKYTHIYVQYIVHVYICICILYIWQVVQILQIFKFCVHAFHNIFTISNSLTRKSLWNRCFSLRSIFPSTIFSIPQFSYFPLRECYISFFHRLIFVSSLPQYFL